MASVVILPKKNKVKSNGEVPLYIRIIKNRTTRFLSLGINIQHQFWDYRHRRVKNSHPTSGRLNSFLAHKLAETNDLVLEGETRNRYISSAKLKSKILGKEQESFSEFFLLVIDRYHQLGKISTSRKCKVTLKKVNDFSNKRNLLFSDIDVSFLKAFELHLRTKLNNAHNTVIADFKVIKRVFNMAIAEEKVERELYPFNNYQLKFKKTHKDQLAEKDVTKLREINLKIGSTEFHSRNMFVFSCYAAGIRISDLLTLKWSNIRGEYLQLVMRKTGEELRIRLVPIARYILDIYDTGSQEKEDFIFPFITKRDMQNPEKAFKAISRKTSLVNKYIKIVAEKADLEHQKISFHWARRTFTCMAISKGMPLEHASKLLGHAGSRVTLQSYAKFQQSNLDKSMSILNH